jgi:hypothetical protein
VLARLAWGSSRKESDPLADTAASAVRNLNNMDIEGRKLRVDFSNESAGGGGGGRGDDDDDRDGGVRESSQLVLLLLHGITNSPT